MSEIIVGNKAIVNVDVMTILHDIKASLTNGKLEDIKIKSGNISVTCPHHSNGREKHASCYINLKNQDVTYAYFHCFSCGSSGTFVEFVAECFDISKRKAEQWLLSHYDYIDLVDNEDKLYIPKFELKKEAKQTFLDDSILDKFQPYHPYMTRRKLTNDIIKKFEIKYDPASKCIVFPVRDMYGRLKFLTRRSVEGKSFYIDSGSDKSDIYALDKVLAEEDHRTVYVTESQINCLTLWSWGYKAIALLGAGTTDAQMERLNSTDILHYVLCYDPDPAGLKGEKRFEKMINKHVFVDVVHLPQGKDINDLTKDEFSMLLNQKCCII